MFRFPCIYGLLHKWGAGLYYKRACWIIIIYRRGCIDSSAVIILLRSREKRLLPTDYRYRIFCYGSYFIIMKPPYYCAFPPLYISNTYIDLTCIT